MSSRRDSGADAPPSAVVTAGSGRWLPNLARGVSVWNLAPDLNATDLLDGRLLTPLIEGPENLPSGVEWDVTGLVPLDEARVLHPTEVERAIVDFSERLARTRELFAPGGSYASYRAAFTVPRLDADGGAHYFYSPARAKILVINWGASPSAAGPSDDRVVHPVRFSELIEQRRAQHADERAPEPAPPRPRRRKPWLVAGVVAAALVVALALVAWLRPVAEESVGAPPADSGVTGSTGVVETTAAEPPPLPTTSSAESLPPPLPPPPLPEVHRRIFFAVDNARLTEEHFAALEWVRAYLAEHQSVRRMLVEGHADRRGGEGGNMALSMLRAKAVKDWLVEHGVDGARLRAVGCATRYPVDRTGTVAGLRANRRVELMIIEPLLGPGSQPREGCLDAPK